MKIAIVTTNFPRWKDDFRVPFIIDAAKAIQRQGHIVRVITLHHPGSVEFEVIEGLEIFRIKYLPEKYEVMQKDAAGIPSAWKKSFWHKLTMVPFFFALCLGTAKYARGFDIIHANWSLSGLAAHFTRPLHHCPYIVTIHGSDIFKTVNRFLLRLPVRIALKNARLIIAVSKALVNSSTGIGISKKNFQVIPTGLDVRKFPASNLKERENSLLYVGSLIPRKGVIFLLRAMKKVKERFPDYKLKVVGEGILANELITYVCENNLENHVEFLGPQPQAEVAKLMRQAKLFILPSIEEGQGAVLVEAMSSGTPCIGSNVGGIPDVITDGVGKLFKPANSESLYESIQYMIENDDFWHEASKQARILVLEKYSWDILAKSIITAYKQALNNKQFQKT